MRSTIYYPYYDESLADRYLPRMQEDTKSWIDVSYIQEPIKLFLSAGPYMRVGFIATQQEQLDLLKRQDWEESFGERKIRVILAEHVWEHLTVEEGRVAAQTCFDYLEPGGYVRCGVPEIVDAIKPAVAAPRIE